MRKVHFVDNFFHTENMPSENILSHFWELASIDETIRLKAASQLLDALNQAQTQHDERRKVILTKFKDFGLIIYI